MNDCYTTSGEIDDREPGTCAVLEGARESTRQGSHPKKEPEADCLAVSTMFSFQTFRSKLMKLHHSMGGCEAKVRPSLGEKWKMHEELMQKGFDRQICVSSMTLSTRYIFFRYT